MIRAIIFDLENTLVETDSDYRYHLVNRILNALGVEAKTQSETDRFWLDPYPEETLCSWQVSPYRFRAIFNSAPVIEERLDNVQLFDDTHILRGLQSSGLKLAIVSNQDPYVNKRILDLIESQSGVEFDSLVSAHYDHGILPKPHAQGVEKSLADLRLNPEAATVVGDGIEDVLAAKAAGVLDVHLARSDNNLPINAQIKIGSLEALPSAIGY